jgi:type IV fimbrial biogenesis protein FimT
MGPTKRVLCEHGWTLAEALLNTLLIATLLASAVPVFSEVIEVYRLRGAARQIFSELQMARVTAIAENNRFTVSVADDHRFKVHDDDDGNGEENAGEEVRLESIRGDQTGTSLTATGRITFTPSGRAVDHGTITVSSRSGRVKQVNVSPAGRIRIR